MICHADTSATGPITLAKVREWGVTGAGSYWEAPVFCCRWIKDRSGGDRIGLGSYALTIPQFQRQPGVER